MDQLSPIEWLWRNGICNLRELYPFYEADCFIQVEDNIASHFEESRLCEQTCLRKRYRHRAHYPLNRGDGIDHDIIFVSMSPNEFYERKITNQQLFAALASILDKQAMRIYSHFFQGMSKSAIAYAEGISRMAVCSSIMRGLLTLEKELRSFRIRCLQMPLFCHGSWKDIYKRHPIVGVKKVHTTGFIGYDYTEK